MHYWRAGIWTDLIQFLLIWWYPILFLKNDFKCSEKTKTTNKQKPNIIKLIQDEFLKIENMEDKTLTSLVNLVAVIEFLHNKKEKGNPKSRYQYERGKTGHSRN